MEAGKISVILPVYNGEKFLKEAVDSILNQTYKNFELLIINDGSKDRSGEIIQSFKDERIIPLSNPSNLGLIKTLNKGLSMAKGEYIARMDADDISMPQRFTEQVNAFKKNPELVAVGSDYLFLDNGKEIYSRGFHESDELKSVLLFSPCFAHPTVMMKNIFGASGLFYNEKYLHTEDYKLWTDLSAIGEFRSIASPLLKYRSHPAQISSSNRETQIRNSSDIRRSYLQKLGFIFSEDDFKVHEMIGTNIFFRERDQLKKVENWIINLLGQNKRLSVFDQRQFAVVMDKFWYDSCGHTSLGLFAYNSYLRSEISKAYKNRFSKKMKLLVKCVVRAFR